MTDQDACPCCAPGRGDEPKPESAGLDAQAIPSGGAGVDASGIVTLPGGEFLMGTDARDGFPSDGEGPIRMITVDSFAIDAHQVTNRRFAEFVSATGYVTDAEKFKWSFVFHHFVSEETAKSVTQKVASAPWWWQVFDADWRHPFGPDSTYEDRLDHPVVHVSFADATAFAEWAGGRLPTEAEWEYAARGGLEQARYAWGDELMPGRRHMCNIWQGDFPDTNTEEDGWHGTAPVGSFDPNDYGLYDVAGNIWEWCSDWWSTSYHRNERRVTRENPEGPRVGQAKVIKGGSYLCHDSYCNRYRVAARTQSTPDSSTGNMGFRLAYDV